MAGRRGEEIARDELSPCDRLQLTVYLFRILWPTESRPPDAPTESYLQAMEKVLNADPPDLDAVSRCWAACEEWLGKALDAENERRRLAGLPPIGEGGR
jgi:hypothetical protein